MNAAEREEFAMEIMIRPEIPEKVRPFCETSTSIIPCVCVAVRLDGGRWCETTYSSNGQEICAHSEKAARVAGTKAISGVS